MAIVIDATPGGASSNSYVTLTESNVIAQTLPHMDFWLTEFDVNKAQLLVHATRLIDLYFTPHGSMAATTQSLLWPRTDVVDQRTGSLLSSTAIPASVQMATVVWAGDLHENPDPYSDVSSGLDMLRTPSYQMEFTGEPRRVVPRMVNLLLAPYSVNQGGPFHRVYRV